MKSVTRKPFFNYLKPFAIAGLLFVSCNDDNDGGDTDTSTDLNSLIAVEFIEEPDTVVSSVPTGNTSVDPNTGEVKQEYLITTKKSHVYDSPSLMQDYSIEPTMLYPGSILRGSSFVNGVYDPLVLTNDFKPVTLFLNIKGSTEVSKDSILPKGSTMFSALNRLLTDSESRFNIDYIPANYSFESTEITNSESFSKAIELHVKANYLTLAQASFDYTDTEATTSDSKYVMVKLKQVVYSAGIDPVNQANWIEGGIDTAECGTHEPVYLSSIDYGRVAYILIETDKSTAEASQMVKASLDIGIGGIGGSANYSYSQEFKSLFSQNKVKVSIYGGSASTGMVNSYDSFMEFMELSSTSSNLIIASAPISYTVRRMKDNTQVEFVNYYTDVVKEYK
ncbi:MAG: thiol-activated cytolysin family protein [Moheibacter sp.]